MVFSSFAPLFFLITDLFVWISFWGADQWTEVLGYSHQELTESPWLSFVHPEDVQKTIDEGNKLSLGIKTINFQNRYRHKNGTYRWLSWRCIPYKDSIYASARDITKEKKIESLQKEAEQLLVSESSFRMVAETIPQIVWTTNQSGKPDYYNQRWMNYTGLSLEETLQVGWYSVLHPEDAQKCKAIWESVFKNGEVFETECRFLKADTNEYRWHLCRALPVRNSNDEIMKWFGTCTDIHDNKVAVEKQRHLLRKLSEVKYALDESSIVVVTDDQGIITEVNNKFCNVSKYSKEELIGQNYRIVNSGVHSKEFFKNLWDTITTGQVWRGEICNKAKDGSLYWVDTVIVPFLSSDKKPLQYMSIRTDITEKKNNELERTKLLMREQAAIEASKMKSQFIANTSHEIRTPIHGIIGMIDLLETTKLNSEQLGYIGIVRKSSESLLNIVNDILDLSKVEAGKLDFQAKPIRLEQIHEEIIEEFKFEALKKNIQIHQSRDANIPATLVGDEMRVKQILRNLIGNAVKFTKSGRIDFSVKLLKSDETTTRLYYEIEDTGIGISTDELEKLFKPFSQIDSSAERKYQGTGLGLAITKQLVERLNGKISVKSLKNSGSCFMFEIDLVTYHANEQNKERSLSVRKKLDTFKSAQILVVDDNESNRMITGKMLEKLGANVQLAISAENAIQKCNDKTFDLIFMDCQMPDMDGYACTLAIRERSLKNKKTTILALTASSITGERDKCIASGMNDCLTKPLRLAELVTVLSQWITVEKDLFKTERSRILKKHTLQSHYVDHEFIEELKLIEAGDKALISKLYNSFKTNMTKKIQKLESAISQKNFVDALAAAHRMKSSSSSIGAVKITQLCSRIQDVVKSENISLATDLSKEVHQEYKNFIQEFEQCGYV